MTTKTMIANHRQTELDYRVRINQVMYYIQGHLDEPLQLETLAAISGFSPYHFHRIFAAFIGETLADYVRRLRLGRAVTQLMNSDEPITVIALDAGYETPSAFSKAFKRCLGVHPFCIAKHR